jgi:homocitrate synthase NifV
MEIGDQMTIKRPWIIDSTLRDGEQAPGVSFDRRSKLSIAEKLDQAGIDELEVGTPAMGPGVREDIRSISALDLGCALSVWCRAHPDDLAAAVQCNVSGIHFSLPVSPVQLAALGKTPSWASTQMRRLVAKARHYFDRVSVGALDATRADRAFLLQFARQVRRAGAYRLRIADTVGIGRPGTVAKLVSDLKATVPGLAYEFHGHNDLGMATANALTALEAGAEAVSVTVNGLGERAGNTALEQLSMVLRGHADFLCAVDTTKLLSLSRLVSRAAGQPVSPTAPVVGDRVFTHESGIHCHAMFNENSTYEPFAPQSVGRAGRRFVLGAHSGTSAIRRLLHQAGIHISKGQAQALKPLLYR